MKWTKHELFFEIESLIFFYAVFQIQFMGLWIMSWAFLLSLPETSNDIFLLPSVYLNLGDNEAAALALWDSKIFILNSEKLKTEDRTKYHLSGADADLTWFRFSEKNKKDWLSSLITAGILFRNLKSERFRGVPLKSSIERRLCGCHKQQISPRKSHVSFTSL